MHLHAKNEDPNSKSSNVVVWTDRHDWIYQLSSCADDKNNQPRACIASCEIPYLNKHVGALLWTISNRRNPISFMRTLVNWSMSCPVRKHQISIRGLGAYWLVIGFSAKEKKNFFLMWDCGSENIVDTDYFKLY